MDYEIQHRLPKPGKINRKGSSYQGSLESIQWVSAQIPTAVVTMCHCFGEVRPDLSKGPKCTPALLGSPHSKHYMHSLALLKPLHPARSITSLHNAVNVIF